MDVEVAVIGGGAVGLAVAAELSRKWQVAVIERHGRFGMETSSHNSGVIHAGIHYARGSLKHTLCLEGNSLLYAWAEAHGVRAHRIGKLIVAVDETDLDALDGVARRAVENGVPEIRAIHDAAELRELEPAVSCIAGLWSGSTGVVDQAALCASYAAAAEANGAWFALKHEVMAIDRRRDGFVVRMIGPDGGEASVTAEVLVNSGGLYADSLAAMLGYDLDGTEATPRMRQSVNKGRYYDIVTAEKTRLFRHLVYPVPEHAKGGLGVHVTIDVDGGVHLGPDTEWLEEGAPLDYRADDGRRTAFHASASRYLPFLEVDDISPGQVGYRPKLQRPGEPLADFLIWREGGYVHLGGIESPGLTASLAIARYVAALL